METIYTWIRSVVIYVILNTIIMNILGDSSYKKYISIVSGMILVLLVISPLLNRMHLEETLHHYLQFNDNAIETSDFQNSLNQMEEQQRELIYAKYRQKIENRVKELLQEKGISLKTFHLHMDNDVKSKTFGKITGMTITAVRQVQKEKKSGRRLSVEKIEIQPVAFDDAEDKIRKHVPSPLEINIKKELSDFYNIEPDNINISIQG